MCLTAYAIKLQNPRLLRTVLSCPDTRMPNLARAILLWAASVVLSARGLLSAIFSEKQTKSRRTCLTARDVYFHHCPAFFSSGAMRPNEQSITNDDLSRQAVHIILHHATGGLLRAPITSGRGLRNLIQSSISWEAVFDALAISFIVELLGSHSIGA